MNNPLAINMPVRSQVRRLVLDFIKSALYQRISINSFLFKGKHYERMLFCPQTLKCELTLNFWIVPGFFEG
jgi:hypothetical protein